MATAQAEGRFYAYRYIPVYCGGRFVPVLCGHSRRRLDPCGVCRIDVKGRRKIGAKALDFRHFSGLHCFEQVEEAITLR